MSSRRWMPPATFMLIHLLHSVGSYWESSIVFELVISWMQTRIPLKIPVLSTAAGVKSIIGCGTLYAIVQAYTDQANTLLSSSSQTSSLVAPLAALIYTPCTAELSFSLSTMATRLAAEASESRSA